MPTSNPTPVSAQEVVSHIRSGWNVFVHGACATPSALLEALTARQDLEGVRLYHLHLHGDAHFASPEQRDRFRCCSLFTGANMREAVRDGRADYVPIFLSDIPWLFSSGKVKLDAALVQLSPANRHGYCTLGTSVDVARAAVDSASMVLAEVNARMPRTHGDSFVSLSQVHAHVQTDRALLGVRPEPLTPVNEQIADHIAALIEDGSTLQMGIGGIPDAVLSRLRNKVDLGVHSEMFSDGLVDLVEAGVITGRCKTMDSGQIVTSFVSGSQRVFDFVDDNPQVVFRSTEYTNDPHRIRQLERMVAINSALQIDMTGQVCADSIGSEIYSGIGGQMDFVRGASLSRGGKPIIALPSTAKHGAVSRIVPFLSPGAGVVTTRGHVHWVVTEFGAVNLHGLSLRERGEALVSLAHPDFRPELTAALRQRHLAAAAV